MISKIKLFSGLFFSALVSLVLFGLVAYDTAISTGYERETNLLKGFTGFAARDLVADAKIKNGKITPEFISHWLNRFDEPFSIFVYSLESNGISIVDTRGMNKYDVIKLVDNNFIGTKTLDNTTYIWHSKLVPGTIYSLGVIHEVDNKSSSYFKSLGVPLIVTAAILLWLTTWMTIYITTLYDRLKTQKKEMEFQATHDSLTQLINRPQFIEKTRALVESSPANDNLALVFININNFKHVNQTLGHNYGDLLLKTVADRIKAMVREEDVVARVCSDEFTVMMYDCNTNETLSVADSILKNIEKNMTINNIKLKLSVSIGIAIYPIHGNSFDEIYQRGEIAMTAAQKMGSRITVFHEDLLNEYQPDLNLISLKSGL